MTFDPKIIFSEMVDAFCLKIGAPNFESDHISAVYYAIKKKGWNRDKAQKCLNIVADKQLLKRGDIYGALMTAEKISWTEKVDQEKVVSSDSIDYSVKPDPEFWELGRRVMQHFLETTRTAAEFEKGYCTFVSKHFTPYENDRDRLIKEFRIFLDKSKAADFDKAVV